MSARRIALLKEIALRAGCRVPPGAIAALRAGEACVGHGVCATVCPTGALRIFEEPGARGLEFDAAACLGCGACAVVCPEQALSLAPQRPASRPPEVERLTRHALRPCARCDDQFAARGEDDLCPPCSKDVALFRTGMPARSEDT